jgi:NAD(P)-dependent dehydrogenase (short-subunit alcohol dehydrogenase family)
MEKSEIVNLFDLTGKVAIVTGGAKGIGEGITTRLAQAGAKVVICDLNTEVMEKTVSKLTGMGLNVSGVHADISVEEDCINLVKKAVQLYGSLDIMVNNAAYYPTIPLLETTQSDWDKVFAVNCRGAFLLARETAKAIVAQNQSEHGRGGSIVFIASLGALRTNRGGMSAYHSSKGAILSLKNELAAEFAPYSIRVNCVLPGGYQYGAMR